MERAVTILIWLEHMAKVNPNEAIRPYRSWSVNGASPEGAWVVYDKQRWMIYKWNVKNRVLTLVNESGWISVLNPLCMQWEK